MRKVKAGIGGLMLVVSGCCSAEQLQTAGRQLSESDEQGLKQTCRGWYVGLAAASAWDTADNGLETEKHTTAKKFDVNRMVNLGYTADTQVAERRLNTSHKENRKWNGGGRLSLGCKHDLTRCTSWGVKSALTWDSANKTEHTYAIGNSRMPGDAIVCCRRKGVGGELGLSVGWDLVPRQLSLEIETGCHLARQEGCVSWGDLNQSVTKTTPGVYIRLNLEKYLKNGWSLEAGLGWEAYHKAEYRWSELAELPPGGGFELKGKNRLQRYTLHVGVRRYL